MVNFDDVTKENINHLLLENDCCISQSIGKLKIV